MFILYIQYFTVIANVAYQLSFKIFIIRLVDEMIVQKEEKKRENKRNVC